MAAILVKETGNQGLQTDLDKLAQTFDTVIETTTNKAQHVTGAQSEAAEASGPAAEAANEATGTDADK